MLFFGPGDDDGAHVVGLGDGPFVGKPDGSDAVSEGGGGELDAGGKIGQESGPVGRRAVCDGVDDADHDAVGSDADEDGAFDGGCADGGGEVNSAAVIGFSIDETAGESGLYAEDFWRGRESRR